MNIKRVLYTVIAGFLVHTLLYAQGPDLEWKDYVLYNSKQKHLIHDFKITEGKNILEKGKIYRYFRDYGLYESMFIDGSEAKIVYATGPDGMVNADLTNKEIYVYPKRSEKVLYLFIMRTMAKALESGVQEIKVKDITLRLEKQKEYREADRVYSLYKVSTDPKIVTGQIVCLGDLLIVQVDLNIFIRNARSYEFEDMFLLPEHFQYDKINLSYTTSEYDYPDSKDFFKESDLKKLLNNKEFEKIEKK